MMFMFVEKIANVQRSHTIEDLHVEVRKQRQQVDLCAQASHG